MQLQALRIVTKSNAVWGLRNYGELSDTIWDGNPNCEHIWGEPLTFDGKAEHGPNSILSPKVKVGQRFKATSAFCKKCGAWRGQLGIEPHPQMYIDHIVQIMEEVKRVLKPTGSLWLNVGDTYFGGYFGGSGGPHGESSTFRKVPNDKVLESHREFYRYDTCSLKEDGGWFQRKQRMMIPERVAIAMQDRGWILRNTVIWYKPNHMPSSATDRLTNGYEPVFFFVKNTKYYFDLDAIRRKHLWAEKDKRSLLRRVEAKTGKKTTGVYASNAVGYNPNGANPADVWAICTEAFSGQHFACYPTQLVERIIKAVCPTQVCKKCGKPRERILEEEGTVEAGHGGGVKPTADMLQLSESSSLRTNLKKLYKTIGWSDCECGVGFEDGIILDPFMGSGTTALTARRNHRRYVGIEINPKFIPIIEERLKQVPDNRLDKMLGLEIQ